MIANYLDMDAMSDVENLGYDWPVGVMVENDLAAISARQILIDLNNSLF
jgi:hypothetical protein